MLFIWLRQTTAMNKRFLALGIAFGIIITIAVYLGSPMFLGWDMHR